MSRLSREQVEKMSPEAQKVLGTLELRRLEHREKLLKKARGMRRGLRLGEFIFCVLIVCIFKIIPDLGPSRLEIYLGLVLLLIFSESEHLGKRLDALIELFEINVLDADQKES